MNIAIFTDCGNQINNMLKKVDYTVSCGQPFLYVYMKYNAKIVPKSQKNIAL